MSVAVNLLPAGMLVTVVSFMRISLIDTGYGGTTFTLTVEELLKDLQYSIPKGSAVYCHKHQNIRIHTGVN
jgi:hypothetical protein